MLRRCCVDTGEGGGGGEWAIPSSPISSSKAWIFVFFGRLGFDPPNNNNGGCRDLFCPVITGLVLPSEPRRGPKQRVFQKGELSDFLAPDIIKDLNYSPFFQVFK